MSCKVRSWLWLGVVLLGLWLGVPPSRASAQAPDPRLVWHTLQTKHFDITYHDPLGPVAQHLANAAERANRRLSHALGFRASQRTLILLTDDSDDANGIANVLPRDEIHLFATAPDDLSPIGDYDDWIATLVTHEHTHILHLDQIAGVASIINALLGKSVAPNTVQPRWFIEGIATYEETAQTTGGRGRSTLFDMMLRMDVLEGRWLTLAQISNDPVRWPHGDIRYLYGSRFLTFIAARYGPEALSKIGHDYGRQLFPYGLNRIAKRATGFTFVELYEQFHAAMLERYGAQRDAVTHDGVTEGGVLTAHSDIARSPRFLTDGRVAFFRDDGHSYAGLYTRDGALLTRTAGEAVASPHPDGRSLVFSQVAPYRDIYGFHDLFRLDLDSGESERLTHGLRASQPDVSPEGRDVVFVTQKSSQSQLELAELADVEGTRRTLLAAPEVEQAFTPRFSPDGKTIVASVWRAGGYRDIVLIDRASGAVRDITHDRAQDTGPTFSPDGARIYFSSDRTGIANVYAFELASGSLFQVTNVVSGAYQPAVSRDGRTLVYVGYTSRGFGLHQLELTTLPARAAPAFHDVRPSPQLGTDTVLPIHRYVPENTLLPNAYQVELQNGVFGYELGIHVAGNDIAGFHHYALRASTSLEHGDSSFSFRYAYGRSPLSPTLRVYRELSAREDLEVAGKTRRWFPDNIGITGGLSYRFPAVLSSQTIDFDYSLVHVDRARPFGGVLDPNDPAPTLPSLGYIPSAGFGYRYSDVSSNAYDISASTGHSFGVRVDATDPIMGRDLRSVSLRLSARQYVPMPWSVHHVLAVNYAGGLAGGDAGRVGIFTIGGFPGSSSLPSLYDLAVFGSLPSLGGEALRGYPQGQRSGTQFHLLQVEYRFPLFDPEWGVYTLPYFLRRVFADVFSDVGDAFSQRITPKDLLVGVGGELFANFELSYRITFNVRIGVARGLGDGGETQFYAHLGSPF